MIARSSIPSHLCLCLRFNYHLAVTAAELGAGCIATPFECRSLIEDFMPAYPAHPYPPLRPLVVYSHGPVYATVERKNCLTIAALSDMTHSTAHSC